MLELLLRFLGLWVVLSFTVTPLVAKFLKKQFGE